MLKLSDFFHLPQLDALVQRCSLSTRSLSVVAGIDSHPVDQGYHPDIFLPSGRSTFFSILIQEALSTQPQLKAVVVSTDKTEPRIPHSFKRRVVYQVVSYPMTYDEGIDRAIEKKADLLVVDRVSPDSAPGINRAVDAGLRVITQVDTVLWGPAALRQLMDIGLRTGWHGSPLWLFSVQRHATLCPHCREAVEIDPVQLEWLSHRFPLTGTKLISLYQPKGCQECKWSGRSGDVSVFDVLQSGGADPDSVLPLEQYLVELAYQGQMALDDLMDFESVHLRRTYNLLASQERHLQDENRGLKSRLTELESSNRLLIQRTEMLVSLQEMAQALISPDNLEELASRVCRWAAVLCGGDRVILYLLSGVQEVDTAEVLAVRGWNPDLLHLKIPASQVFSPQTGPEPTIWTRVPPGVLIPQFEPPRQMIFGDVVAGLRVPLVAQGAYVGMLYIHSTIKKTFSPSEVALFRALANQAALGIQRARLIDDLRGKISELESAQVELMKKERQDRELELAHEVQQNFLPKVFPRIQGLSFAAQNEPAREVGGDFYDVFEVDSDHVGLIIADVSDKGLPAALYMALSRSLIIAEARRSLSPREVLIQVNQLLLQLGQASNFVSVFYGLVNPLSREVVYASAGHDRPLLVRNNIVTPIVTDGAILGVLPESELHLAEAHLQLLPGDTLILYTDGLTDVVNPAGEFLGLNRLVDLILSLESLNNGNADHICSELFSALKKFQHTAEQFDDMTLLVMVVE